MAQQQHPNFPSKRKTHKLTDNKLYKNTAPSAFAAFSLMDFHSFASSWVPSERHDRIHLVMVGLHAAGAIGAYAMSMYCDVLSANQRAMLPKSIHPMRKITNFSHHHAVSPVTAFRAGYPWSQDHEFPTHVWNPYLLVVAFEWITAAFALCTLRHFIHDTHKWVMIWVNAGLVACIFWFVRFYIFTKTQSAQFPAAMAIMLCISFAATTLATAMYMVKADALDPVTEASTPAHDKQEPGGNGTYQIQPSQEKRVSTTRRVQIQGRNWYVHTPNTRAYTAPELKRGPVAQERPTQCCSTDQDKIQPPSQGAS
jgi:hypothetical protein